MRQPPDVSESLWQIVCADAEQAYPAECCGLMMGKDAISRVKPCVNAQNKYHELDPENFPRDDRKAYFIEPRELLMAEREMRERGERLLAIYHSHPDADAYFSREDQARAVVEGEPIYPGAGYLVLSVRDGKVCGFKWFTWDGSSYVESSVESDRSD